MSKLLLGFFALLATAVAHAQDWRGPYIGVSVGYFDARSTWTTTQLGDGATITCPPACDSPTDEQIGARSAQFGTHVGYNWALGRSSFIGLEVAGGKTNASKTMQRTPGFDGSGDDRIDVNYDWNVSLAARVGFTAGRAAFYGLIGPSWQNVEIHYVCPGTASWCLSARETRRSDARFGWVAGAGMELRVDPRWSTRLDLRYAKYKDMDYIFFADAQTDTVFASVSLQTITLSLGLTYHF